ncbi:GTPase activating protein [Klebsormidium nitens]|uniref:GTPase activating protein n=1 Tax=Klebsormidium nitens TaxID=105231 RepID=A0A1Y1HZL0_KLENI|nr:GTPase activating protein [Klebsormidium nitens]|eukprot:GAQ82371.1 GTPase activating protein [Klebsormidium nitens]
MFKKGQPKTPIKVPAAPLSRDIYGFAVRPQHAEKYKEYGPIYQEEERERAERWESFLQRTISSADSGMLRPATPTNADQDEPVGEESDDERRSRSLKSQASNLSASGSEGGSRDWTSQVQKEWPSSLRMSLWPVERAIDARDKKRARQERRQAAAAAGGTQHEVTVNGAIESEADGNQSEAVVESADGVRVDGTANESSDNEKEEECAWEDELRALVKGGVPMYLRGELWQLFAGAKKRQVPGHYQALLLLLADGGGSGDGVGGLLEPAKLDPQSPYKISQKDENVMEKWTAQIEKDLPRTFPGHPVLDGGGRDALRRLLTAFARHNPDVGYCQGMNFLAALLLLLMPEEAAFWTLTALVDDLLHGYYSHNMIEAQVDQLVLEELLRLRFPTVVSHLDTLGVAVHWVSAPWFLSVFVNVLPWESVLRVWDVLLFEDDRTMLFRTALALIDMNAPPLTAVRDAGDAVSLLQSLAAGTFDSSALVLTACGAFADVESAALEVRAAVHRPQVTEEAERRQAEREAAMRSPSPPPAELRSGGEPSTSSKAETTPRGLARGVSKLWRTKTDASGGESSPGFRPPGTPEHAAAQTEEQGSEVDDLRAQIAWLKKELVAALEKESAASIRADELEAALVQVADKRHLDETKRSLQAQVEELTAAGERLQAELDAARASLREREAQAHQMTEVLAKIDQEHRETEEARVHAEADVVRYRHTQAALEAQVGILQANLAAVEERARQAENMLEAISRSALEAGASRSGHASPLPAGSPATGSPAQPPATAESFGKKALFGLTMKWRGAAEKKGPVQAKEVSSQNGSESTAESAKESSKISDDLQQDPDEKEGSLEAVPL